MNLNESFLEQLELDDRISNSMTICPYCGEEYPALLNKQVTCGKPLCDDMYKRDRNKNRKKKNT